MDITLTPAIVASIGAGLVTFGAAYGIGKLGSSATDNIARQPEASGDITKTMIIAAAMLEGVALFCALVCLLTFILGDKAPAVEKDDTKGKQNTEETQSAE